MLQGVTCKCQSRDSVVLNLSTDTGGNTTHILYSCRSTTPVRNFSFWLSSSTWSQLRFTFHLIFIWRLDCYCEAVTERGSVHVFHRRHQINGKWHCENNRVAAGIAREITAVEKAVSEVSCHVLLGKRRHRTLLTCAGLEGLSHFILGDFHCLLFWGARRRRTWGVEVKTEPQSHYFDLLSNPFDLEAHNSNVES